jgi:hypothetical protein
MFSTTFKRCAVTLGVAAGLLAAAGPASAQGGGGDLTRYAGPAGTTSSVVLEDTMISGYGVKAGAVVVLIGANDYGVTDRAQPAPGTQVGSEG